MSATEPAVLQLVWDGVAYDLPVNLTPREDMRIHSLTGCWAIDILQEQLPKMTTAGLAGLLVVAMERRFGKVDADAIFNDQGFNEKISINVPEPEVVDANPPADAAPAEPAADTPPTSETPEVSGSPSS